MNFTIEGRKISRIGDPLKSWLWEMVIPDIGDIAPSLFDDSDDYIVRVRSCNIPARGIEAMESKFMGFTQWFTGKPTNEYNFTSTHEEFQDMKMMQLTNAWRNAIVNLGPTGTSQISTKINTTNPGASVFDGKRSGLTKNIFVRMYETNGDILPYQIKYINAWPENVESISLDYNNSDSVKINVLWRFDYWELVNS
jgi:hypothetical protein